MVTILDFSTTFKILNVETHTPENPLFEEYLCQISSFYHNLKDVFSYQANQWEIIKKQYTSHKRKVLNLATGLHKYNL